MFVPSYKLGLSPTPSPARECVLPELKAGHTRLRVRGGRVYFVRLEKKPSTLPILLDQYSLDTPPSL